MLLQSCPIVCSDHYYNAFAYNYYTKSSELQPNQGLVELTDPCYNPTRSCINNFLDAG